MDAEFYRYYARMTGAVFTKVLLAGGGFWLGDRLDRSFGTGPWLMILCFVIGAGLGLYVLLRAANHN